MHVELREMPQNSKSKSPQVRKLCSMCMGMVRFTRNKHDWMIDTCDYCEQIKRVKIEAWDESNETIIRSLKSVPYPLPQLQEAGGGEFGRHGRV